MKGQLCKNHKLSFTIGYYRRVATIKTVLEQQQSYFETGVSPKNYKEEKKLKAIINQRTGQLV